MHHIETAKSKKTSYETKCKQGAYIKSKPRHPVLEVYTAAAFERYQIPLKGISNHRSYVLKFRNCEENVHIEA